MTVLYDGSRVRGLCRQLLMVVLINVPTVSLGLAMGWVSLASGEHAGGGAVDGESGGRVVVAAATTFLASLVGVPLSARALTYGRKFAVIATSACFVVCWSLKLSGGGWRVVGARVAAGLGGAGAYSVPPLIAREMCESSIRGAASSALILAHNLGFLVMYMAADFGLQHSTVLWSCLAVSAVHCVLFLLVPESPAYLAATGRHQEAAASLAWLRGLPTGHPTLDAEVAALPPPDPAPMSPIALFKDMLSDMGRRRAFIICFVAIVGQEACGVYTLMQFAERAFVLARDTGVESAKPLVNSNEIVAREVSNYDGIVADALSMTGSEWSNTTAAPGELASREIVLLSPARQAVILGVVQLIASAIGLYLVEKVGRRKLLVWCGVLTALCLCAGGACAAWAAGGAGGAGGAGAARWGAGAALAGAVGADSAGLQSAPYALLADMFTYQHRSCAMMVISAAACAAGAAEVGALPALAASRGLAAALLPAALLAAAYALFAALAVPETRGRDPRSIYRMLERNAKRTDETQNDGGHREDDDANRRVSCTSRV